MRSLQSGAMKPPSRPSLPANCINSILWGSIYCGTVSSLFNVSEDEMGSVLDVVLFVLVSLSFSLSLTEAEDNIISMSLLVLVPFLLVSLNDSS